MKLYSAFSLYFWSGNGGCISIQGSVGSNLVPLSLYLVWLMSSCIYGDFPLDLIFTVNCNLLCYDFLEGTIHFRFVKHEEQIVKHEEQI